MQQIGKYAIELQLGRGGMAEVWLGRHETLNRNVAIKLIHTFLSDDASFQKRFVREAQLIASLRHPNIVQLFDFDIADDRAFMVMEYLNGGTLRTELKRLQQNGQLLPLNRVEHIVLNLADGLSYAHRLGAIHCDLKPANILFDADGEPVIGDFGIARLLSDANQASRTGGVTGTPNYMSPEQVSGKPVSRESDLYSLGVILFELLTGRVPFSADSPAAVMEKHLHNPPPNVRDINPSVPQPVADVVRALLAKNVADRVSSAEAFAALYQAAMRRRTELVVDLDATMQVDFTPIVTAPDNADTTSGARLEQLSPLRPDARRLITLMVLTDSTITYEMLTFLAKDEPIDVAAGLDELWKHNLISSSEPTVYAFADPDVESELYASLSPARRELLHRRAAGFQSQPLLSRARHYEMGNQLQEAVDAYAASGFEDVVVGNYASGVHALRQALTLLKGMLVTPRRQIQSAEIATTLVQTVHTIHGWQHPITKSAVETFRHLVKQLDDATVTYTMAAYSWLINLLGGDFERAATFSQTLWYLSKDEPHSLKRTDAHFAMALTLLFRGKSQLALRHIERAIAHPPDASTSCVWGVDLTAYLYGWGAFIATSANDKRQGDMWLRDAMSHGNEKNQADIAILAAMLSLLNGQTLQFQTQLKIANETSSQHNLLTVERIIQNCREERLIGQLSPVLNVLIPAQQ